MSHIHEDIWIAAPAEAVFALYCDATRWRELGFEGAAFSNFSGPMDQVGTTFDVTASIATIERKGTNTVVEIEPNRLIRVRGSGREDMIYRFEPEGDGTRFSCDAEYDATGVFYKLLDKVVLHRTMERATRQFNEKIKAMAEAKAPVAT
jgi:carbon monoxide dehydrogenase subunit G